MSKAADTAPVISLDICALEQALASGSADAWTGALQQAGWPESLSTTADDPAALRAFAQASHPPRATAPWIALAPKLTRALPVAVPIGFIAAQTLLENVAPDVASTSTVYATLTALAAITTAGTVGLALFARQYATNLGDNRVGRRIQQQREAAVVALSGQPFVTVTDGYIVENYPGTARLRALRDAIVRGLDEQNHQETTLQAQLTQLRQAGVTTDDPTYREVEAALAGQRELQAEQAVLLDEVTARIQSEDETHQLLRQQARQLWMRQKIADTLAHQATGQDELARAQAELETSLLDLRSRHEQSQHHLADIQAKLSAQAELRAL